MLQATENRRSHSECPILGWGPDQRSTPTPKSTQLQLKASAVQGKYITESLLSIAMREEIPSGLPVSEVNCSLRIQFRANITMPKIVRDLTLPCNFRV